MSDTKRKAKDFPVKFCLECKRCYEGPNYLKEFPTIGLKRRECVECRTLKEAKLKIKEDEKFVCWAENQIKLKVGLGFNDLKKLKIIANKKGA